MTKIPDLQLRNPRDEFLDLPIEQGVLLWCLRMKVIGLKRGIDADTRINRVLDMLGAAAAWPFVRDFVGALSGGCTRYIDVQCVCQTSIGPDEYALLDVLSLAQAMRPFEATLVLRGFVTQAGAEAALRSAEGIGTVLAEAGRFLPEPEEAVQHFALTPAAVPARSHSQMLHCQTLRCQTLHCQTLH